MRQDNEQSKEEGMLSNQRIKQVILEEVACGLDLEGWVGSGHAEMAGWALHAEEIVRANTQAEKYSMCKKIRILFTWLQLRMSEEE